MSYINSQCQAIEPIDNTYHPKIVINNNGHRTNWINIDSKAYEAIKAVLLTMEAEQREGVR